MPDTPKLSAKINGLTLFNLQSPRAFTFVNSDGMPIENGTIAACTMARVRSLSLIPSYEDVPPWKVAESGRVHLPGLKYQRLIVKLSTPLQRAILRAQVNPTIDLILVEKRVITAAIHSEVPLTKLVLPKPYDCQRRLFFANEFLIASDLPIQHVIEHDSIYKVRKGEFHM